MTMNVMLGNFSKDNYKKYSNKINHIHILDINELKNKEIKEVNIKLHTASKMLFLKFMIIILIL